MSSRGINTKCWEWEGHIHNSGYGRLTNRRKTQYAHRFMWEAFYGEIPKGFDVCHTCDNKICVNPDHLFLGTRKDNMIDAKIKNRLERGEKRHNAILNEDIVKRARAMRKKGMMIKDIAAYFSVSSPTIRNAIIGKTWSHVI